MQASAPQSMQSDAPQLDQAPEAKRLKVIDDDLPEPSAVVDAAAPIEIDSKPDNTKSPIAQKDPKDEPEAQQPAPIQKSQTPEASLLDDESKQADSVTKEEPQQSAVSDQPPETASIYLANLVRPFMLPQLKEMLAEHGELEYFWIDQIKSHCYVTVRLKHCLL